MQTVSSPRTSGNIADTIANHLRDGGAVQITTYARSTVYDKASHADLFTHRNGCSYIRRGKHRDCFTQTIAGVERALVGVRFGRIGGAS